MTQLVEEVRREHRRILELVDRLQESCEEATAGGLPDPKLVHDLVGMESRHEVAEARVLWPVVRDALREMYSVRATAQSQEREARRLLHRLHKARGQEASMTLVPKVIQSVRVHVALEETEILASLETTLSRNESMSLGTIFHAVSIASPTRPHPWTPAIPGVLSMTGPMARRADSLRDLLRRR